jgi:TonB family protein
MNDIRSTIAASRDRFRACYDQALKKHAGIEGKFVLHFVIHPNGSVKAAEVDNAASQIHVDEMGPCAISVLKTLKFPISKKGMESTVNYPFDFHPKGPMK